MIGGERWEEEQLKILFKLYEIKDFEIFLLNFENAAREIMLQTSSSLLLFYLTHLLLFYYFISLIFFSFTILSPFLLLPSSLISFPFTSIFFFLSTQFDLPFTVSLLHYLLFSPFLTSVYFYSNSLLSSTTPLISLYLSIFLTFCCHHSCF